MKTRTIRYLKKGGLRVIEVNVTDPKPGEVQVKAAACGICKWDVATFKNGASDKWAAPDGHEGVGYVWKVGKGVKDLKEGDRVAVGSFAGYRNYTAQGILKIPRSKIPDEQWIVEPVSCVVNGLDTLRLLPADRVAVVGCGYMGLMFIQALGRSLTDTIIALDIDDEKLALARQFGATETANPKSPGFSKTIKKLRSLSIDKVIDCTGTQQGLTISTELVRGGGLISLSGWIRGEARFPGTEWHMGGFTVVNSAPGCRIRNSFPPAIRLLHKGYIDQSALITDVVTLDEYGPLLRDVTNGRKRVYIKGVVKLND